jgi:SnoaL-like protein
LAALPGKSTGPRSRRAARVAMSHDDVEIVRRWLWAFENSDETFARLTHPKMEWAPFEDNYTVSHGLSGAMRIRSGWLDPWAEHHIEIEEMLGRGHDVMAAVHLTARGESSGVDVDVRLYGHFKVREGKVAYLFEHQDRDEALKAVGLSE